jgi:hypothetical protein
MMDWVHRALRILLLFFSSVIFSCEEQGTFANCDDCIADEPLTATLEFTLDNSQYTRGKVFVYEGNIEDSILYASLSSSAASLSITVNINKLYTATTTYYIPDKSYVVVDSAIPRVKYTESQCEEPCYYVYDRKLDLRLK